MRTLSKAALALVAAAVVLLVVLYAIHPASKQPATAVVRPDRAMTGAAQTAFAPVTPFTPIPSTPSPDQEPRSVDLATGTVKLAPLPADFVVYQALPGGRLLLRDDHGQTEILSVTDDATTPLPAPPYSVFDASLDGRYIVWLDDGRLHGYDLDSPANGQSPSAPLTAIPAARFSDQLPDGSLLLCTNLACPMTVIVAPSARAAEQLPSGGATEMLPTRPDAIASSSDGRELAWDTGGVMRVYDRKTGMTRTYDLTTGSDSPVAWSPDGRELAYIRVVGDDDVRVAVVDLASGALRDVYDAPPDLRIRNVAFTGPHTLRFDVPTLELYRFGSGPLRGAAYEVNDDGSGGHAFGDLRRPWAMCGPACGLPPAGLEDAHGLAWWFEVAPHNNDLGIFHLDLIDRAAGTTRELLSFDEQEADPSQAELSPDGRQIAIVTTSIATTGSASSEVLHVVPLAAGARASEIPLGYTNVPGIVWLPDSSGIMLYGFFGN